MCPGWWVGRRGCCLLGLLLLLLTTTTKAAAGAALPALATATTTPSTTTISPATTLGRPWDGAQEPSSYPAFYRHGHLLGPLRGTRALPATTPEPSSLYYSTYQSPSGAAATWGPRGRRLPPLLLETAGEASAPPAGPSLRHSGRGRGRGRGRGPGHGDRIKNSGGAGEEGEVIVRWGGGTTPAGVAEEVEKETAGGEGEEGGGGEGPPIGPTVAPPEVTPLDLVRNTRSTPTNITRNFRHHHKYRHQLYNENSRRVLKLLTDGTVNSTDNLNDPHTLLYLHPINSGVLVIRSEATGLYLCMNNRGKLYASCNLSKECEFMRQLEDTYYDTLQSRLFPGRYIAIAPNGRIKRARKLNGPLGKEHFFLSRRLNLEDVHRIIEQYHKRLETLPPQRCACYNMTSGSSSGGGHACTVPTPPVTVEPVTSQSTTVRPLRCKTVKRGKKCRKRPKCKSKKCRKRKKHRRKSKKGRRKKEKVQEVTTTPATTHVRDIPRRRKLKVKGSNSRIRHQKTYQFKDGSQRQIMGPVPTNASLQARRPRRQHLHTYPSLSLTTPTPSSHSTLRLTSNTRRPRLGTITTTPTLPFPSAPSSAHPNRAHNARRQRRPRGPLKSPTSVTA
ncbi:uncharacterized protein [Palaemon carinicauda]|uniref:uncharacterized protein n=1 Tax=Palaemon carinicauda TaxID=392227 RepID=UPI0035B6835B